MNEFLKHAKFPSTSEIFPSEARTLLTVLSLKIKHGNIKMSTGTQKCLSHKVMMHSWENCILQCRIFRAKETSGAPLSPRKYKIQRRDRKYLRNSIQSDKRNFEDIMRELEERMSRDCMEVGG